MSTAEPERHVAVRPQRLLPGGRPGRVDHARLGDQAVRALRMPARVHVGLARAPPRRASRRGARCPPPGRPGPATAPDRSAPSRPCRRPARTGTGAARPVAAPGSRSPASATSWRGVTSSRTARAGGSSSSERDPVAGLHLAAQRRRARRPARRSSAGAAALDHRPAHRVRRHREQQPERAGHRGGQRQHRVRGHPGEQALGLLGVEPPGQRSWRAAGRPGRTGPWPADAGARDRIGASISGRVSPTSRTSGPSSRR